MKNRRQLKIGTVFYGLGQSLWSWLDPKLDPTCTLDFNYYARVIKEAEAAKLDFVFIGDGPGVQKHSWPHSLNLFEPLTLLAALSRETTHIGLVSTQTTSYVPPYIVARQFASLDNLSNGRAGWNVVTTADDLAALNFGVEPMEHDERYRKAAEHVEVVRGLWDSWEDDAFLYDRGNRKFYDPDKFHELNHKGEYFSVRGPINISRSPQGHPVIAQAGSSDAGIELGARIGDMIYTGSRTFEIAKSVYGKFKQKAASFGRSPDEMLIMPGIAPIIGSTEEEAERRLKEILSLADINTMLNDMERVFNHDFKVYPLDEPFPDLDESVGAAGMRSRCEQTKREAREKGYTLREVAQRFALQGNPMQGTPEQIADEMQRWFENGAADGFVLNVGTNDSLSDVIEHVLPILKRRGVFREEYEATTLRGHLGLPAVPNRYSAERSGREELRGNA